MEKENQVQGAAKTPYEIIKEKIIDALNGMSKEAERCGNFLYFHFGELYALEDVADCLFGFNMLEDKEVRAELDPLSEKIDLVRSLRLANNE